MAAPTIPYTIPGTVDQERPVMECRIGFENASAPDPLVWWDFTEMLLSFEISRGSENELTSIDAGTATVVLHDPDRNLDSFNTSSPLSGFVKPRRRLWLRSMWNGEAIDQFYGWTGSIRPEWPTDMDQVASVPARDALSILAGDNMPVSNPPRDSFDEVILVDQPLVYYRANDIARGLAIDSSGNSYDGRYTNTNCLLGEESLIVGERDFSYERISTSGQLRGPSPEGRWPIETGHTGGVTVEFWYRPSAVAGAAVGMFGSPWTNAAAFLDAILVWHNAGVPQFTLRTGAAPGSATTVTSSVTMSVDTTYYIVAYYDGANMSLRVNDTVNSAAKTGAIPFEESTSSFPSWGWPQVTAGTTAVGHFDEMAIYPYALSTARLGAHWEAGTIMGHAQDSTDRHIEVALEDSDIAFIPRRLRTGQRDIQPVFFRGQSRREWWDDAVTTEGDESLAFIAKDGAAVFLDNDHRSVSPWSTVQAVFDDDGTDIAYLSVEVDDGESFLFNDVRRTPKGGTLQWTFDTTSIDEYDRIVMDDGETLNVNDADALAEVTAKLAKYKDPQPRIPGLALKGDDPEQLEQMLRRELGDKVQVRRRPFGVGVVIDQTSFVRKITLSGERGGNEYWTAVLAVSPL